MKGGEIIPRGEERQGRRVPVSENESEKRDPSFTDMGVKFTLGSEGVFAGYPYPANIKIRIKEVSFDNEFKNYKAKISYSTLARFLDWLKKPENKKVFNDHVGEEKLRNEGTPLLE